VQNQASPVNTSVEMEIPDPRDSEKGIYFIALSQFGIAFCFNCIMSFMPFYILKVSHYSMKATILWTGLIMGGTSLVAALAAPFWGSLTARIRPKLLFQSGMFCTGVIFFIMGFSDSLPLILALRLIQGAFGGISTIGLVLIAGSASKSRLARHIGHFQNSMTAGQLAGPPIGAYAVTLFGYRAPFVIALGVLLLSIAACHRFVRDIPPRPKTERRPGASPTGILWGWGLICVGTIQLMFLPSILPQILENFHLTGDVAVGTAGTIMMIYMAAAIAGNYLLVSYSSRMPLTRLIVFACLVAGALQCLLYLSNGVFMFTLLRSVQTGMIAGVIPLVIASFADKGGGTTLGFLNSGRFVGNAAGPMMATSLLAHFDLLTLYLTIAGLTLAMLSAFMVSERKRSG
jgi:DHA1 family multidrug resistance protein-like MFS transporter